MTLTDKQKTFADVVASGASTTAAALVAGYGEAAAASVGSRLSRDFGVLAYINNKRLSAREEYTRKIPLTLVMGSPEWCTWAHKRITKQPEEITALLEAQADATANLLAAADTIRDLQEQVETLKSEAMPTVDMEFYGWLTRDRSKPPAGGEGL